MILLFSLSHIPVCWCHLDYWSRSLVIGAEVPGRAFYTAGVLALIFLMAGVFVRVFIRVGVLMGVFLRVVFNFGFGLAWWPLILIRVIP